MFAITSLALFLVVVLLCTCLRKYNDRIRAYRKEIKYLRERQREEENVPTDAPITLWEKSEKIMTDQGESWDATFMAQRYDDEMFGKRNLKWKT